ncbi:hypothetical protein PMZ80_005797 [Knufia obscura]|uniref:Aminoglycoside phosphotransferase domain-containing protein n=1 Tax=Knufia obscura TaxID=1635080 RepID=A0ABR0RML4_9EURO|nr:hypothetical protein PMZ80_005797 [Knufia obscura]
MPTSFPLTLPYYMPVGRLPAPLPSIAEITLSKQVLSAERGERYVVRIGEHYVAKYGHDIDLIEGENLLFIRESCNIDVPEVYAIFCDEKTNVKYIIMGYVAGENLMSQWEDLNDLTKENIAAKLRAHLDELRRIPSQGYYGRLGRRAYFDQIFMTLEDDEFDRICGPFETQSQFIDAIVERYLPTHFPQRGEYLRRVLPTVLVGHPAVFTHNDLQRKNIIVRNDGTPCIIDWEYAAFYPKYYEYYSAMIAFGYFQDDWHVWIGKILHEYVTELGWLDTIRRELFYGA